MVPIDLWNRREAVDLAVAVYVAGHKRLLKPPGRLQHPTTRCDTIGPGGVAVRRLYPSMKTATVC